MDKIRPVLILSTFIGLHEVHVIPATTRVRGLATEVKAGLLDGLNDDCVFNAQQLQLIPTAAVGYQIGTLSPDKLEAICTALERVIGC
jgi:mRNA-degrading endonuclease toxin of MazEF toxin-antitoxin module